MRVTSPLLNLSWQATAVLGLAVLALAAQLSVTGEQLGAERAAARAAGQPAAVALAGFARDRDIHEAGEVHVIARVDPTAVVTVTKRSGSIGGGQTRESRRLYLLADPRDPAGGPLVRAAVLLPESQVGRFLALIARTPTAAVPVAGPRAGRVVALNGIREAAPALARPALAAIRGLGLEPAPEFIFVMPWFDGRDAALADREGSWRWMVGVVSSLGATLLVLAFVKRLRQARDTVSARRALEAERIRR